MLTTTKTVLSAPLPRVFEESANGKAVPVATPAQGPIGGGFQQEELGRVSKETVTRNPPRSMLWHGRHAAPCNLHAFTSGQHVQQAHGSGAEFGSRVDELGCESWAPSKLLCPAS